MNNPRNIVNKPPPLRKQFPESLLKPGDCILYRPADFFDGVVAFSSDAWISHVEVYYGVRFSVASRNGQGVGMYPVRLDHVAAVLRPGPDFNLAQAMAWFHALDPKPKYGWATLLNFVSLRNKPVPGHMICSEFAAHFFAAGGTPLFAKIWPYWRTRPSVLLSSRAFPTLVWQDDQLFKKIDQLYKL